MCTHTHTHTNIYIYMCVYVYIFIYLFIQKHSRQTNEMSHDHVLPPQPYKTTMVVVYRHFIIVVPKNLGLIFTIKRYYLLCMSTVGFLQYQQKVSL